MKKETGKRSLKDQFVKQIMDDVLTDRYSIGEKLPTEREFAMQLDISRTVIHAGLEQLEANGVVQREGHGWVVADYKSKGKMPIIDAILTGGGVMSDHLLEDFIRARALFESETARLAALNRSNDDLYKIYMLIREGHDLEDGDVEALANLEFRFHCQIAAASGNTLYPILMNSMEDTVTPLLLERYCKKMKKSDILLLQERLFEAIQEKDPERAVQAMNNIFDHRLS